MEYFHGTLDDKRIRDHLSTCFQCRSRLKDLSLTMTMVCSPGSDAPGEHVPSEIMAQYVEDTLSIQQNRAVEVHMAHCRRCLADLVSLRTATGMPLKQAPPEAVAASVKEQLNDFRLVTPLGELLLSSYEDEVNLAFEPAYEPDEPEIYKEKMAEKRFPFKKSTDLNSCIEPVKQRSRSRMSVSMPDAMEPDAGNISGITDAGIPSEPTLEYVPVDTALIFFWLAEVDGKQVLMIEIQDLDGSEPLAGVEIIVLPARGEPVIYATDDSGTASLAVHADPSTLRIHLEKIYELDLRHAIA